MSNESMIDVLRAVAQGDPAIMRAYEETAAETARLKALIDDGLTDEAETALRNHNVAVGKYIARVNALAMASDTLMSHDLRLPPEAFTGMKVLSEYFDHRGDWSAMAACAARSVKLLKGG
jgi:hypothetical protein